MSASTAVKLQRERTFYTAMAVSMTVVVFVGFAPTFFLRPWFPDAASRIPPESIFYVHGVVFAAWMAFLIAQTLLVRTGNIRQHRKLGWVGAVLASSMVILGTLGAVVASQRPGGFMVSGLPPLEFLANPLVDMVLFGLFVGLAVLWRRDAQRHKRLMLLATVNLLAAAIARVLPASLGALGGGLLAVWLSDVFILALVIWDIRSRRRLHSVTLWGGLLVVISQPSRVWMAQTSSWVAFAEWFVGVLG